MAIEGNDWWTVAGAAASGILAGVVGANLIKSRKGIGEPARGPVFMGIRRWYEVPSTEDVRDRAVATIWQKDDGYWLRVYRVEMPTGASLRDEAHTLNMIREGIPVEVEERDLGSAEEAMEKADQVIRSLEMAPITDWGYPSEKTQLEVRVRR